MTRSLANFPTGLPALGLLLLRVAVATALILIGTPGWLLSTPNLQSVLLFIATICILLGLLTKWMAVICSSFLLLSRMIAHGPALAWLYVMIPALAVIAILGPGAYSVDSLLHGRRRRISLES